MRYNGIISVVLSLFSISFGYYIGYSNGVYNSFQQNMDNVRELKSINKSYKDGDVAGAVSQIELSLSARKAIFETRMLLESDEITAAKTKILDEINSKTDK